MGKRCTFLASGRRQAESEHLYHDEKPVALAKFINRKCAQRQKMKNQLNALKPVYVYG
ncbi:hypothetical protein GCM10011513_07530 [Franconibacter daqui]|nr:hypothetical protein GCM10011513_07530 [Franconibacter daqui]